MDLTALRYVTVVAQTQNLQQAAAILRVTPAALSKAVKRVEDEFNIELFYRTGRQLILSQEGRAFCQETADILKSVDSRLYKRQADNEKPLTPVRIGSFDVFTTYFMSFVAEKVPLLDWEIHDLSPGKLEDALSRRVVDLGLSYVPVPHAELDFISLTKVAMGVFGQAQLFQHRKLNDIPFVVPITPVEGNPSRVEGLDGWPEHLHPRRRQYRVTRIETALALCRRGLAIGYFPKFVINLHNNTVLPDLALVEGTLPDDFHTVEQEIFLIKRKHEPETAVLRTLAKLVRKLC